MAATSLATHAGSRKCCPNRLRALTSARLVLGVIGLAAPVSLLDFLDLLFAHAEVVAELVDQRLADGDDDVVLVAVAVLFDRPLEERDAIGQLLP